MQPRDDARELPKALRGLIIGDPWIGLILDGRKIWEMRSRPAHHRGPVALIWKGTKTVVGVADLVDVRPRLETRAAFAEHEPFHAIPPEAQKAPFIRGWRTPWVLANVQRLRTPVPYEHPSGAVTWVKLDGSVIAAIEAQFGIPAETTRMATDAGSAS
jgi:hypothetical protein